MACAIFTGIKVQLRNATFPERDALRDGEFVAVIGRLLGKKIGEEGRSVEQHLVLLNAVSVGAGQPLEQILDHRQADPAVRRVALPQTTLRGEQCEFQPVARLGAFTCWLR